MRRSYDLVIPSLRIERQTAGQRNFPKGRDLALAGVGPTLNLCVTASVKMGRQAEKDVKVSSVGRGGCPSEHGGCQFRRKETTPASDGGL